MKLMTSSEAQAKRRKAIEFLRRLGKEEEAVRFEAMDARDYAQHKGAELLENPNFERRLPTMARSRSKSELEAELDEANDYIEELETKLDDIVGITADADEEDEEEGEDDQD